VEFNTLTASLTNFVTAFQSGYQRLGPAIHGLLASLAVIDIVLIGCWWALGGGEQLANVIKKIPCCPQTHRRKSRTKARG
jgi:type IV secretion system protein TrbL